MHERTWNPWRTTLLTTFVVLVCAAPARADLQREVYDTLGIKVGRVLSGTVIAATVIPGPDKQVVSMTTMMTGKREHEDAVNVRLDVLERVGEKLVSRFSRDFGSELGGAIGQGDVQLVDLDRDGAQEIIVSYEDLRSPLIERRVGEVIVHEEAGFRTAWSGPLEYDATRAARDVPAERRDRFVREIDLVETLRTRGITLFINKTVIAVAGERLPEPKQVQETFPLREAPSGW
jgi:hypothetical protein